MSSIVEGYKTAPRKVIQKTAPAEDVGNGQNDAPQANPSAPLIAAATEELLASLTPERCKRDKIRDNVLLVQTANEDTPAIEIEVRGYEAQEGVLTAARQEAATKLPDDTPEELPEDTDQVADVRKFNTDQYMKHSNLNPKKFG